MADPVVCPVCGERNPPDMEFCRNCQSRLRPVSNENEAIQPGELPTRKHTSELEPLLPQWLRDARQNARDSDLQEPRMPEQQPAEPPEPAHSDLLAGLASQSSDEEDDIPDWLAQITGAQSKKKKPVSDDNQVKWVELGHGSEPQEAPIDVEGEAPKGTSPKDDLSDWFSQAAASSQTADFRTPTETDETQPSPEPATPAEPEDLSWLRRLDSSAAGASDEPPAAAEPPAADTPDWMKTLRADQSPVQPQGSANAGTPPPVAVPDWLKSFGEDVPSAEPQEPSGPEYPKNEEPLFEAQLPDWLKSVQPAAPEAAEPELPPEQDLTSAGLPDWMLGMAGSEPQSTAQEPVEPMPPAPEPPLPAAQSEASPAELPDWLSSIRSQQDTSETEVSPSDAESLDDSDPLLVGNLPDLLSALRAEHDVTPAEPSELSPALTTDELSGEDADAIFASMQAPDWLSAVLPASTSADDNVPAAAPEEEPINPADLPSWVRAMRPVEAAMAATPSATEDVATEAQGPLAGLHGVLPVIPGAAAPSSKPKAYSIKLDATEQQQAHAALLDQILAAETSPIPMRSAGGLLRSQRALRWALSVLLIAVLGGILFARTESFQLPSGVPNETVGAIQAVESIPDGAPVLLVFDYQPATVGEMEASGASLIDHLLLLKHPNIVLLSTSPTGPALAERFVSTALADRAYVRGTQYVDLGFLPGGLAGVYKFAQNPAATVPLDAGSKPVWNSAILSRVEHFSDFAATIVLTDSIESGRTWVEQTEVTRGKSPLIFVSSAQAGPMLLPYVDAGQVNGMVSGIYGAAGAEQRNAGSPAIYGLPGAGSSNSRLPGYVRRYWDSYSVGLYIAVISIVLGALVSLLLGIRDRRSGAVG